MASVTDAELKSMTQEERVTALGMRTDQLTGRKMRIEFNPDEEERFEYPWAPAVDFNKRTELDVDEMDTTEANKAIRALMAEGYGTIVIKNPRGKHSLGVGILSKLNLIFEGSLGYFGVGLLDGPNVRINGRVGWSCGENMMSGEIIVDGDASQYAGATGRGGLLVIKGNASSRCGISMKGIDIVVHGNIGHMSAFMAQSGSLVVLGDAGDALGDSIYEATLFVRGRVTSLGADCVEKEMRQEHLTLLTDLLDRSGANAKPEEFKRYGSARQLYNFNIDNLGAY